MGDVGLGYLKGLEETVNRALVVEAIEEPFRALCLQVWWDVREPIAPSLESKLGMDQVFVLNVLRANLPAGIDP